MAAKTWSGGVFIVACVSGLASPGPMAAALWTDEELEADITLDAIVTVVDACHIARQLDEPREDGAINEAQEQVAYADVILLNKVSQLWTDPSRILQNKHYSVLFAGASLCREIDSILGIELSSAVLSCMGRYLCIDRITCAD